MNTDIKVQIVLPTYNGGRWIEETLQSIYNQTYPHWQLLIRDDGSRDSTLKILGLWKEKLGHRLVVLNDGMANLGSSANCLKLLANTTAPYILFTGQDDIWFPERIQLTIDAFTAEEGKFGASTPIVVASDAQVVDAEQNPIAPSFYKWSRINPKRIQHLRQVAMEGPVLGAAMAINRAMADFVLPLPDGFYDEDSWFGIVAVAFGKLVVLETPTIRYRRHGLNASDNPFGSSIWQSLRRSIKSPLAPRQRLTSVLIQGAAPQAAAFYIHYQGKLKPEDANAVKVLGDLPRKRWLERRVAIIRNGLWYSSFLKNVGLMILL